MNKITLKTKARFLIMWAIILLVPAAVIASEGIIQPEPRVITGKVTDEKGIPLIGVSVTLVGSSKGVVTDVDGYYTIKDVPENATLRFTYIGFVDRNIKVPPAKTTLDVKLSENARDLNEVVVVAYGVQKKENLLSSVGVVEGDNLLKTTASTTSTALVGKVAGVNSRHFDGAPGSSANISIRNLGAPLYIVDGIIKEAGEFNNLDMNDIESISIVKDGSAAIYGVKAANGVVIVKTKRGAKGKFSVNVNFKYGWQSWAKYPEMGNAFDVAQAEYERQVNSGTKFSAEDITKYRDQLSKWKTGYYNPEAGEDYRGYDWTKFARKGVPIMQYNINASGGSDRINYYLSLSHVDQDAVFKDFNFSRNNFQANIEAKVTDKLKIGMITNGRIEKRDNPGLESDDDYFYMRWGMIANDPRYRPFANDNPKYPALLPYFGGAMNLAAKTKGYAGFYEDIWRVFQGNWFAEWETPLQGLRAKFMYSYFYATKERNAFQKAYDLYTYDPSADSYKVAQRNEDSWMQRGSDGSEDHAYQFTIDYDRTFKDTHHVMATFGMEAYNRKSQGLLIAQNPVENNFIPVLTDNRDLVAYINDTYGEVSTAGFIGRLNYDYKGKYLAELSARYDGSWRFPKDNRWGFFPSVSLGWRISEEDFFKNSQMKNWFNNLKIRANYGEMGDDNVPGYGDFAYLGGYTFNQGSALLTRDPAAGADNSFIKGSASRGTPVTTVSWLTAKMLNVGFEAYFLKNRLSLEFDLFQRRRSGLLANQPFVMPAEVSVGVPPKNLNTDMTSGMDATMRWRDQQGDFNYSVGVNMSLARLKNEKVANEYSYNSYDRYLWAKNSRWANAGGKAGTWCYQVTGQFSSQEEIDSYPVDLDGMGNTTLLPGDYEFKDWNKDGKIDDYDLRPLGYGTDLPYLNYGINLEAQWKGLDFTADFSGADMQTIVFNADARWPLWDSNRNAYKYMFTDRWHHEDIFDPASPWVPGNRPALRLNPDENGCGPYRIGSGALLYNVRYIRLKNIEIGYTFPKKWLEKVKIQNLRIFVNGSNLLTFDNLKNRGNLDPEQGADSGLNYPIHKIYTIGANFTF